MQVQSLDQEDPLEKEMADSPEKEMAAHSSILALAKSHGQRSLEGHSQWSHRVNHDLATNQQQQGPAQQRRLQAHMHPARHNSRSRWSETSVKKLLFLISNHKSICKQEN